MRGKCIEILSDCPPVSVGSGSLVQQILDALLSSLGVGAEELDLQFESLLLGRRRFGFALQASDPPRGIIDRAPETLDLAVTARDPSVGVAELTAQSIRLRKIGGESLPVGALPLGFGRPLAWATPCRTGLLILVHRTVSRRNRWWALIVRAEAVEGE
jgi:hypothetical protein